VARQPAAQPKPPPPAAATTPPALAALLAPPDRSAPSPDLGPSAELAHLGADRMYQVAWTFQQGNDFDSARAIYGDLLNYFPDTPRAAYARFEMGEMYLKEGLAFGAYLSDAADAFAQVAGDPRADPPLVSFALMRLEQTSELTGDATRAAESKDRLTREFPRSDAAKSLLAKSR
jgi:TolA-binding protein